MSDSVGLSACRRELLKRLRESAPGRIQMLVGPRQVGKTTLLLDLVSRLGPTAFYASADEPAAALLAASASTGSIVIASSRVAISLYA
ncbi:MAG: hypothetical protein AMXMBFR33_65630 [Candidatus Xenobia bacterium]